MALGLEEAAACLGIDFSTLYRTRERFGLYLHPSPRWGEG